MKKNRVQIIGSYLEDIKPYLLEKNILVENIISRPSPLAMAGTGDETLNHFCDEIDDYAVGLSIKKNLKQMLSHSEEIFCDNLLTSPLGTEVRYKNSSEYVVVFNSYIALTYFESGSTIYSDFWPQNQFTENLKSNSVLNKHTFPFDVQFNWKYYYDKFIDAILSEYDSEHIILIRINSAQWYMDDNVITKFEEKSKEYRNAIEEIDEYFIQKTHCHIINNLFSQIPNLYYSNSFPYNKVTESSYKYITESISEIVINKSNAFSYKSNYPYALINTNAKYMSRRFSSSVLCEHIDFLKEIDQKWVADLSSFLNESELNDFISDLVKLKYFINPNCKKHLTDYIHEKISDKTADSEIQETIKLYLDYFKLDINDLISIFQYFQKANNRSDIAIIAKKISEKTDFGPVRSCCKFFERNLKYLANYKYMSDDLKNIVKPECLYIELGNSNYLVIDPLSDEPMRQISIKKNDSIDYIKIADKNYACTLADAEGICVNWKVYIEKGKRKEGSKPFRLVFTSKEEFVFSLYYIDYSDLLECEKFILTTDAGLSFEGAKASTNLEFLFKQNTKIFAVQGGLGDQTTYYVCAKILSKLWHEDADVYFYDSSSFFNGREFDKIICEDVSSKLISNLISKKLLNLAENRVSEFTNILYANGVTDLSAVLSGFSIERASSFNCSTILVKEFTSLPLVNFSGLSVYWCLIRPDEMMQLCSFKLSDYVHFPSIDDETNREIMQKMLSSDAISIHIRRGDLVRLGRPDSSSFCHDTIKKLLKITEYTNRKWFIFSDSIPYCKQNPSEFGFDLIKDDEIIFVDNNKNENSFRDLQLMTYSKVIVCGNSSYPRLAALYSDRCEMYISSRKWVMQSFESIGKKNRFNI